QQIGVGTGNRVEQLPEDHADCSDSMLPSMRSMVRPAGHGWRARPRRGTRRDPATPERLFGLDNQLAFHAGCEVAGEAADIYVLARLAGCGERDAIAFTAADQADMGDDLIRLRLRDIVVGLGAQ